MEQISQFPRIHRILALLDTKSKTQLLKAAVRRLCTKREGQNRLRLPALKWLGAESHCADPLPPPFLVFPQYRTQVENLDQLSVDDEGNLVLSPEHTPEVPSGDFGA